MDQKIGQRNITGKKKGYDRERALDPALTLKSYPAQDRPKREALEMDTEVVLFLL